MLRKSKKAPTLYELIRERPAGGPFSPGAGATSRYPTRHTPHAEPDDSPSGAASLLSPGRVVRIPVGYLFFAGAIVLALIVAGYAIGYKKRDSEAAAERQREAQRALAGVTDPLQADPLNTAQPVVPRGTAATPERPVQTAPVRSGPGSRVVRIDSPAGDPRQSGLNYLVIAFLPENEAQRAAEFLAAQGLEIGLVKVDNRPSWREVVDLQGLEASQLGSEASDRIRQRVTALGREYKRQERGPVDFADAYWKKHQTR